MARDRWKMLKLIQEEQQCPYCLEDFDFLPHVTKLSDVEADYSDKEISYELDCICPKCKGNWVFVGRFDIYALINSSDRLWVHGIESHDKTAAACGHTKICLDSSIFV